jgi:predicted alpha/beta-fold hydrolase
MRPFQPLFRNPHILTIVANFYPRRYDEAAFPKERRLIQTDPDTKVLVETQHPRGEAKGHVVMVHGLEGSGESGYIVSMAWAALNAGFITHRFHMRTCAGTENHCKTLYHAGLTGDLRSFLMQVRAEGGVNSELPIFLVGYSLGGNVVVKLAGELGETDLIQGVCGVSVPLVLARCTKRMQDRENLLYERRFVKRMKKRMVATGRYTEAELAPLKTIWDIDDQVTAPSFGFRGAAHYYETQSAINFVPRIRVPALLIQAKDDTYIPFEMYSHPALAANPSIRLLTTEHGGHLGFLQRRGLPRFWLDGTVLEFIESHLQTPAAVGRNSQCGD